MSGAFPVIDDLDVGIVVVATRRNSHAELIALALKDGWHVWFEKPVALSTDELPEVATATIRAYRDTNDWHESDQTQRRPHSIRHSHLALI